MHVLLLTLIYLMFFLSGTAGSRPMALFGQDFDTATKDLALIGEKLQA